MLDSLASQLVLILIGVGAATVAVQPATPDLLSLFGICLAGVCAGTLGRWRYWLDKRQGFLWAAAYADAAAIFGLTFAMWGGAHHFQAELPMAGGASAVASFLGVDLLRALLGVFFRAKTGHSLEPQSPDDVAPMPPKEAKP